MVTLNVIVIICKFAADLIDAEDTGIQFPESSEDVHTVTPDDLHLFTESLPTIKSSSYSLIDGRSISNGMKPSSLSHINS